MFIKGKKILVLGLGITGLSALKLLCEYKNDLMVYDEKPRDEILQTLRDNNIEDVEVIADDMLSMIQSVDFVVKSPGLPPDHKAVLLAESKEIPVISDIELAFNMGMPGTIVAITGTNGKTTSTILAGQILEETGSKAYVAGNVGKGVLQVLPSINPSDYLVLELSSFQLEHTYLFKPKVAMILNITPDHLDWHGNFENYMKSKSKIFSNQGSEDFLVLNWDQENLRVFKDKARSKVIWFSIRSELREGVFLSHDQIVYRQDGTDQTVLSLDDIRIPGEHNLENICGVVAMMKALQIDSETIRNTIGKFKGVEHRIEFVGTVGKVDYYNDSKGTNPESTIKAIRALEGPIVLIAGGYDKKADYMEMLQQFMEKGRALVLMGATKDIIGQKARSMGIQQVYMVQDMEEAVSLAGNLAKPGDQVLLSPACASWDMFRNYEERGNKFKELVNDMTE